MAQTLVFDDDVPKAKTLVFDDEQGQPSIASGMKTAYGQRVGQIQDLANQANSGQISTPEAVVRGGLKSAQLLVSDLPTELFKAGARKAPEFIKEGVSNAASAIGNIPAYDMAGNKTNMGDLARSVPQAIGDFQQEYPVAAGRIGSALDAVNVVAPFIPIGAGESAAGALVKGVDKVADPLLNKTGNALMKSGEKAFQAKRNDFVQDLLTPKLTAKVKRSQFANATEEGLLRNRVINPTQAEQSVIDAVAQLPVKKSNSLLKNYNIISDANRAEAESLAKYLAKNDVVIPDDAIQDALINLKDNLSKSPYIVGDGEKAANKVINVALEHITKNKLTAAGQLKARKEFDASIRRMKGANAFDPTTHGAVTDAIQQVRQSINGLIDTHVPDAGAKQSLAKQSSFYRAMDNIETKGGDEGKNLIVRLAKKASDSIPGKTMAAKAAVSAATLGTAVLSAPVAAGGLAAYGLAKGAANPVVRKGLGGALIKASKLTKDIK